MNVNYDSARLDLLVQVEGIGEQAPPVRTNTKGWIVVTTGWLSSFEMA